MVFFPIYDGVHSCVSQVSHQSNSLGGLKKKKRKSEADQDTHRTCIYLNKPCYYQVLFSFSKAIAQKHLPYKTYKVKLSTPLPYKTYKVKLRTPLPYKTFRPILHLEKNKKTWSQLSSKTKLLLHCRGSSVGP